jgi:hypothetical protein
MGVKLMTAKFTVGYIGRYTKRPCLTLSRIKRFDQHTNAVTFEYQDKKENIYELTTLPAPDFIALLIRHIHQPHFKQIRYYGLYSQRTRSSIVPLCRSLLQQKTLPLPIPSLWRERTKLRTNTDPLLCPICRQELILSEICYRSRDGPLKTITFPKLSS